MKMKKIISFAMAIAMTAAMTGCQNNKEAASQQSTSTSESASASETAEKVFVIGGSGPLTGDYASYGKSCQNGAALAAEEINANGGVNGYKIEVKYEDDMADAATAVNAYATLMDKGMNVSLGAVTSGACIAVAEEAKKDGILMITPTGSQKDCTKYDNGFRVCFTDPVQGSSAADVIKEKGIASKVAVIYDKSNDYSVGIYENFVARAKENGIEVVTEQAFTNQSNTDFSVQLGAVKSSGADLLFLPIYAQEAAYILTQADKMEMDIKYFGCDGLDGILEKIGEENKALTEGVMLLTPFSASSQEKIVADFVTAYKTKYNQTPDQFAADGYDAVYAVAKAVEKAEISDVSAKDFNDKIIAAMTSIEVDGATGKMTWTADGEPVKKAIAVKIANGEYEII